ncbi:MAG: adenylate/guanylate cyclase domain-containing protein [Magnetococcales bacterium]|nr:adenylate/guanylate cyclase domain-containing protein [Magnetococcales bacterium]MBF0321513.1 adenylate/guanylate cyclase domain-containing protein [Magnetococcales bacterium]
MAKQPGAKHYLVRHILSSLCVALFTAHLLNIIDFPALVSLENVAYDLRVRETTLNTMDPRIVIVDIDEKSLAEEGRWPWSRKRMADLIHILFDEYGIGALGFDVVFAEPETNSGLSVLEELSIGPLREDGLLQSQMPELRKKLSYDQMFADALSDKPVVLGFYFKSAYGSEEVKISGTIPPPLTTRKDLQEKGFSGSFVRVGGYGGNLETLQRHAMSGGFFDSVPDADGVFRRQPVVEEFQDGIYPSLSLALARLVVGPDAPVEFSPESISVGSLKIPVDGNNTILVPFRGTQGSFPYISATDILHRRAKPESLSGVVVLVGTTAPGLMDMRSSPVQSVYPGVEIHANIISGIMDGRILSRPDYLLGMELTALLIIGALLALTLPRLSPVKTVLLTLFLLSSLYLGSLYAWKQGVVISVATIAMLILTMFILHTSYGFFVEARSKRKISRVFGQYIPKELVDEMNASGQEFTIGGESREMTVLFSDVRGFTTVSEGLRPEELTRLMNFFLTPMTHVIQKHRGTIDKYMGDAIMAFWGAPLQDPKHAENALHAAVEMIQTMIDLGSKLQERGWPTLKIGVGLNSGTMNVGNMGSEFRMAYTVLGDAVNLGSRLESLTKQYGVNILVGETTRKRIPGFLFREIDLVRVKGKHEPVAIFEPLGDPAKMEPKVVQHLDIYQKALDSYRHQAWEEAKAGFSALQAEDPERKIYDIYLERIQNFQVSPPGANWDGVYTHTSK